MNHRFAPLFVAAVLVTGWNPAHAAEEKSDPQSEKKSMRILAAPDRESHVFMRREVGRGEKPEMETVAFLGVETGPVSGTLSAQLGLARGTGLVVNAVLPKSAAAGVLNEHDILLKLDDQILIETRQLSVLVRGHKEGDEVLLTYLRAGQKASAKIKLGKTDVPKMAMGSEDGGHFGFATGPIAHEAARAEVDRVLSMIPRSGRGDPVRIQVDRNGGPGIRAMAVHPGTSTIVFNDDAGNLELTTKEGQKSLVATDPKGGAVFSGPVTTPEERAAMPDGLRQRLEKLEGMRDVTFRTDGEFRGNGAPMVRPRGISVPLTPAPAEAPRTRAPAFF